jgi:hypothetical protein
MFFLRSVIVMVLAVASVTAYADERTNQLRVSKTKDIVTKVASTMEGVNGIGITACKEDGTGGQPGDEDLLPCIVLFTETLTAANSLVSLWPIGSKINDVFLVVSYAGEIVIQPRASGGN